jgi:type III restriction enzyme
VWKGRNVFALDTKGEHILESELGRKLLAISPHAKGKTTLVVRFISRGEWNKIPQRISAQGFTVWTLGQGVSLNPIHCATLADAAKTSIKPDL